MKTLAIVKIVLCQAILAGQARADILPGCRLNAYPAKVRLGGFVTLAGLAINARYSPVLDGVEIAPDAAGNFSKTIRADAAGTFIASVVVTGIHLDEAECRASYEVVE